ncbi:LysR substrate-binding domain-containing protein [Kocuria marina]|uniref:LysR substrate-binding domain-containing protein n=1 Tax=Kocuria marina TaxID=223184 RepID=UPI00346011F6
MEIRHLRTFLAVAEELHFGRAAARLHMAQPPVSQHVQQLEKELGVQLFERNNRSVALTEAGRALLKPAERVLIDVDLARRAAMFGSTGITGRVSIGFAGASSRQALPQITRAVRTGQPGIDLALRGQTYGGAVENQVLAGELDMGFTRLPIRNPGLQWHVFDYERLVIALPEDHPLTQKDQLDVEDLEGEPFVSFPATQGSTVRDATTLVALNAGFTPRIVQEAPDSYTILSLVAAGVGTTVTVSSVQHIELPGLCYRPFSTPVPQLAAVLVWRKNSTNPALQAVLDIARELLPPPTPVPELLLK